MCLISKPKGNLVFEGRALRVTVNDGERDAIESLEMLAEKLMKSEIEKFSLGKSESDDCRVFGISLFS